MGEDGGAMPAGPRDTGSEPPAGSPWGADRHGPCQDVLSGPEPYRCSREAAGPETTAARPVARGSESGQKELSLHGPQTEACAAGPGTAHPPLLSSALPDAPGGGRVGLGSGAGAAHGLRHPTEPGPNRGGAPGPCHSGVPVCGGALLPRSVLGGRAPRASPGPCCPREGAPHLRAASRVTTPAPRTRPAQDWASGDLSATTAGLAGLVPGWRCHWSPCHLLRHLSVHRPHDTLPPCASD